MNKEFKLSEEDLEQLLGRCKPVPMIMLQCGAPASPQENANNAWKDLGGKLGFDHMTVKPVKGKDHSYFTADTLPSHPIGEIDEQ